MKKFNILLFAAGMLLTLVSCTNKMGLEGAKDADRGDSRITTFYPMDIFYDEITAWAEVSDTTQFSDMGFILGAGADVNPKDGLFFPIEWREKSKFFTHIDGLTIDSKYYIRAYATQKNGVMVFGKVFAFHTASTRIEYITFGAIGQPEVALTAKSATVKGVVSDLGGSTRLYAYGVRYWPTDDPSNVKQITVVPDEDVNIVIDEEFFVDIADLKPNTEYQVQICARNERKMRYQEPFTLTTQPVLEPSIEFVAVREVGSTFAIVECKILSKGNDSQATFGVYYGTSQSSLISKAEGSEAVDNGDSTYNFEIFVRNLAPTTSYYFQGYVRNDHSEAKSVVSSVSQTLAPGIPAARTIQRMGSEGLSLTTALVQGVVLSDGGMSMTGYGIHYGTSPDLGQTTAATAYDQQTGDFSVELKGLTPSTTYYYAAFVSNASATTRGTICQFRTGIDGGALYYADQATGSTTPAITAQIKSDDSQKLIYFELDPMQISVTNLATDVTRNAVVYMLDRNLGARDIFPAFREPTGALPSTNIMYEWCARYGGYYYLFNQKSPTMTLWVKRSGASLITPALQSDGANVTNVSAYLGWPTDNPGGKLSAEWENTNNPCPAGYTIPSSCEWQAISKYIATKGKGNGSLQDVFDIIKYGLSNYRRGNGTWGQQDETNTLGQNPSNSLFMGGMWSSTSMVGSGNRTVVATVNRQPGASTPVGSPWTISSEDTNYNQTAFMFAISDNTFGYNQTGRDYALDVNVMINPNYTPPYSQYYFYDTWQGYGITTHPGRYAHHVRCIRIVYE